MPDLTSFWISFRVALISTMIVTIFGILISKWLYNKKILGKSIRKFYHFTNCVTTLSLVLYY